MITEELKKYISNQYGSYDLWPCGDGALTYVTVPVPGMHKVHVGVYVGKHTTPKIFDSTVRERAKKKFRSIEK